jgi:SAM-dependent methyltransferase
MELQLDLPESPAKVAYDDLAPYYDRFTHHHRTDFWLEGLLDAATEVGLAGTDALDVACGTGKSMLPLIARGWTVTGCDVSAAMLAEARRKLPDGVRLVCADMRDLPVVGSFDLVTCLCDAVNYLEDEQELKRTLAGMRCQLRGRGVLIFDVNTLRTYRTTFAESMVVEAEDFRLVWRGRATTSFRPGACAEAVIQVEGDGASERPSSVHRQRHFAAAQVVDALAASGFELLRASGHGVDGVLDRDLDEERHTKAVYIARPRDKGERR